MRIGIDFGTTRTVVSAVLDGRYSVLAFDCEGRYRDYLPGLAALHEGQLLFGDDAMLVDRPRGGALTSVKRTISTCAPEQTIADLSGEVTALNLTTAYLRWVRWMIEHRSNLELEEGESLEAMVAVPAGASSRQRYLTLEAFKRAGFDVVGLLGEPTAAAIEYAYRNTKAVSPRSPKRYVVVYDLGGGTFDTAAVSLLERRFQLIASEGIGSLGGADFDRVIAELAFGAERLAQAEPSLRVRILEVAREAKETLRANSRKLLVDLSVASELLEPVVLDTATIYAHCQPLIERTVACIERLFAGLGDRGIDRNNSRQLGALYLVGGASAFPPLAKTLRARYPRKIQLAPQPHAATAIGLAVAADPKAGLFVREATTRHFGVWREAEAGREKVFDPILSKDMLPDGEAPLVIERRYRPTHPIGHFRFLECSGLNADGQPMGDLTPWDEVRFPYDPELIDRAELERLPVERRHDHLAEDIVERYVHELDGTIQVEIENQTRGYRKTFVLGALR